ncbi:MAG: GNAT family N-acetyltransferase, partial [Desulfofustis sp.]|nr:GNAT family N-acetyltransferase [Desulfofustis sp.]
MFRVDQVIAEHYPALNERKLTAPIVKSILRRMLHEQAFVDFAEEFPHLRGIEFVEQVLDYFSFSYTVSDRERENIPPSGKVMIIANHPIGSLDGLALLKLVHEIRSDVRIVANDLLMSLEPLRRLLLPVRVLTGASSREHIQRIHRSLEEG